MALYQLSDAIYCSNRLSFHQPYSVYFPSSTTFLTPHSSLSHGLSLPLSPFSMWINEVLPHGMSNCLTEDTKTHWLLDGCQGTSTDSLSLQHQRDGRGGECTCRFHRTYVSDDRRPLILTSHLRCAVVERYRRLSSSSHSTHIV